MIDTQSERKIPDTIGVIMDGNRRWAREHGRPVYEGHKEGYKRLKEFITWSKESGVKNLFIYAFSTENWGRTPKELEKLFALFRWVVTHEMNEFKKDAVCVTFVGQKERFPDNIQKGMADIEKKTQEERGIHVYVGFSYGGRAEIVDAARRIPESERGALTEEAFAKYLWTGDMPDPDMIIRVGGEHRLSNFLLWQGAYAELFFSDTYWPAFTKNEFERMLGDYGSREKRVGV